MNNVVLIGRLTRDPELQYLQTGTAVCRFTLAVDRGMSKEKKQEAEAQNKQTADFINITAWGKTAENAANYLKKGLLTAVEGRIQSGSYEKDGQRIYTTDVNARAVEFIEWPDSNKGSSNQGYTGIDGFSLASNEDIPF